MTDINLPAQYAATQINTKINEVQKQIGAKKKVRDTNAPLNDMELMSMR
jgi:hypothetical protein